MCCEWRRRPAGAGRRLSMPVAMAHVRTIVATDELVVTYSYSALTPPHVLPSTGIVQLPKMLSVI
jgi:hypothetical protein